MNRQSISLGKLFGIPLSVDLSWFLILVLFTWSFAEGYYPSTFANWPTAEYWVLGALTSLLLFVCVVLHELGHSFVARRFGLPVKGITLFLFGGVSTISEEPKSAISEFSITIAGPVVSLLLAAGFGVLMLVFHAVTPVKALMQYLMYINLFMSLFNLIPGFPLDGGGVVMAIVWGVSHNRSKAMKVAAWMGRVVAYLGIIAGFFQMVSGALYNGIWTAFLGWFLLDAANTQLQQEKLRDALGEHATSEAMSRAYTAIQGDTTLQYLVDEQILRDNRRSFIVESGDEVIGLLTLHQFSQVAREKWPFTTVREVMLPIAQIKQVSPETDLWDAFSLMDRNGVNQLPVMIERRLVGVITREDVITFMHNLQVNRHL